MRKVYETPEDLINENEVKFIVETRWKSKLNKLPKFSAADYLIEKENTTIGFAEIKCRKKTFEQFYSYSISLNKYIALFNLAELTGLTSILIVSFNKEKIMYLKIDSPKNHEIYYGGRFDRNDPEDAEAMIKINLNNFIEL